jgi:hypothetical protein
MQLSCPVFPLIHWNAPWRTRRQGEQMLHRIATPDPMAPRRGAKGILLPTREVRPEAAIGRTGTVHGDEHNMVSNLPSGI